MKFCLSNKFYFNFINEKQEMLYILSTYGLKLTFCHTLPMSGDLIKFTAPNFFLPAMKLFLQKQAVITTTITKYIYNDLNVSFTYKKEKKRFIDLSFFLCPKNFEILVLCMFSASGAVHFVTPVSHIFSLQNICCKFFPHTHVNGL